MPASSVFVVFIGTDLLLLMLMVSIAIMSLLRFIFQLSGSADQRSLKVGFLILTKVKEAELVAVWVFDVGTVEHAFDTLAGFTVAGCAKFNGFLIKGCCALF